jgi:titin
LRQAILDANAASGPDSVYFNIGSGPQIIRPSSALPIITGAVLIDGTTQPGYINVPIIRIDGTNAGGAPAGLQLQATGCSVVRLAISGFASGAGILIEGGGRHIVAGCHIGPEAPPLRQNGSGIVINNSVGNQIGVVDPVGRNVIMRNAGNGIRLVGSSSNVVEANYIGTDVAGAAYGGNGSDGIALFSGSSYNSIGGTAPGAGNVVAGNNGNGIYLLAAPHNVIKGNKIGCDVTGSLPIRNLLCGINMYNCPDITIGGTAEAARNLISGNGIQGIEINGVESQNNIIQGNYIGTDATGLLSLPNFSSGIFISQGMNHRIGGFELGAGNLISANAQNGISFSGGGNHVVQGNLIGVDRTGNARLGNLGAGVQLTDSPQNVIGGTEPEAGNIISGNSGDGIAVNAFGSSSNNSILGNYIGTDVSGTIALPNARGVSLSGRSNNNLVESNVVSGNLSVGLLIGGQSNLVVGNFVGTDVTGRKAVPNGTLGIEVGLIGNTIGGPDAESRNVISGNRSHGIQIDPGSAAPSSGHVVQGNYVGVDVSGAVALPNGGFGIALGARETTIGGFVAGAGNIVSGNSAGGIFLGTIGPFSTGMTVTNLLYGNFIGTDSSGKFGVPNTGPGVLLASPARNNFVGGTGAGEANTMAFNKCDGVLALSNAVGNPIQGNSIHSNGRLGINLKPLIEPDNAVTPNDVGDADTGPNNLQNFPVITNVVYLASSTVIQGYLLSSTNRSFSIDVYANVATENSGYGEGQFYVGNVDASTDASGLTEFAFVASATYSNQFFTAAATDKTTGDTSEFSAGMGGIRITSIRYLSAFTEVSFTTIINHTYHLQRANSLTPPISWSSLATPAPIYGTGGVITVPDPTAGVNTRFYRVLQDP